MNNNALQLLLKERDKLISERDAAVSRFNGEIQGFETAIERLSGKKVWEISAAVPYDDEHPDYIKGSQEEM